MSDVVAQPNVAEPTGVNPLRAWVEAVDQKPAEPSAPETEQEPGKVPAGQADAKPGEPSAGEQEVEKQATDEPEDPIGVKKRIDKLTREKKEALEVAEKHRIETERLRRELADKTAAKADLEPEPLLNDFDTHEAWTKAVVAWTVKKERVEREQADRQARDAGAQRERGEKARSVIKTGMDTYKDFNEVVGKLPITDDMLDGILLSESPHELVYTLGQSPDEALRIASLSPKQQVYEIARLDYRLTVAKETNPIPKVTGAPPPIKSLRGGGEPAKPDPDKLKGEDWFAKRRRGLL